MLTINGTPTGGKTPTNVPKFLITQEFLNKNNWIRDLIAEHLNKRIRNFGRGPGMGSSSECREWTGARNGSGYGFYTFLCTEYGFSVYGTTHKVAYMLVHPFYTGKNPIIHRCENKLCCNLEHLKEGTHGENRRRAVFSTWTNNPYSQTHRLSMTSARKARKLHSEGATIKTLAETFDVCYATMYNIINNLSYLELEDCNIVL